MRITAHLRKGVAVIGVAVVSSAVMTAAPPTRVAQSQPSPSVARDVRLTAMAVPPGGLVTSVLGNQVIYCTLICPLLIQTGVTPIVTTLAAPGTFLTALQSGDLLKAIGVTAASVTGPTNTAAQQAILVDGEIPAQRALNAFEVGVIGLLNIAASATGGLPAILAAVQTARQDTFTALNLPIVPNPASTVVPRGALQIAALGVVNVGAAVIFPAFDDILSGAFQTPDAIAQELAATGNPIRAVAAGVNTAATAVAAAVTVIAAALPHPSAAKLQPTIGRPTKNAKRDLRGNQSIGGTTRPLARKHTPDPAKAANANAATAGGNDHEKRGGDSARGRSNRHSRG